MKKAVWLILVLCVCAASAALAGRGWRQVHPYWHDAYVLSFRSPDLLSNEADEQWGAGDGRLVSGGILTEFPVWLEDHRPAIRAALRHRRPVLLSLHTHSGYGTGLVTYSPDLQRAQAVNYPWLIRTLLEHDLGEEGVTVAVDTCNAQATAAMQIRPDLVPAGVAAWSDFKKWRSRAKARRSLPVATAYDLYSRDRVASHLGKPAKGKRQNVASVPLVPLTRSERREFRAKLYGQKGVILATPTLFNLLRLGPEPRGTLTANLLTARLSPVVVDSLLAQNKAEFRKFREYAFLNQAGIQEGPYVVEEERRPRRRSRDREGRIERRVERD